MNTVVTLLIFNLMVLVGLPAPAANAIGYSFGIMNSFFWNRRWTFRDRRGLDSGRAFWRFGLVMLGSLAITTAIVAILEPYAVSAATSGGTRVLALNVVEGLAVVVGLFWNYLLVKHWAFAEPADAADEVE